MKPIASANGDTTFGQLFKTSLPCTIASPTPCGGHSPPRPRRKLSETSHPKCRKGHKATWPRCAVPTLPIKSHAGETAMRCSCTMRLCNKDKAWCMSKAATTANAGVNDSKRQALPPPRFMPGCRPKKSNADSKGGCRDICKCWRVPVRLAWALTRPTSVGCFMQAHPPTSNLTSKKQDGQAAMANPLRAFSTWKTATSACCRDASSVNSLR